MTRRAEDDPVRAWLSLPRRIYLDTSTLQNLYDFGGEIFEASHFNRAAGRPRVQGLADEIGALQIAAYCEGYLGVSSVTIRTARARHSGE